MLGATLLNLGGSFFGSKADIGHYQSIERNSFSATSSMGSKDLKVVFTW